MINVNYQKDWITKAEKYTQIYETNPTDENQYNALYMVNYLSKTLQTPSLNRLNIENEIV